MNSLICFQWFRMESFERNTLISNSVRNFINEKFTPINNPLILSGVKGRTDETHYSPKKSRLFENYHNF